MHKQKESNRFSCGSVNLVKGHLAKQTGNIADAPTSPAVPSSDTSVAVQRRKDAVIFMRSVQRNQ